MELDDGTHGNGGGQKMDQVLQLEKKKEKNKNGLKAKVYLIGPFLFRPSRHNRVRDWV
jgi:hypothetical protein